MKFIIDPTGAYQELEHSDILRSLGVLPSWALDYPAHSGSMKQALIANYPYYFGPMNGQSIDSAGVYRYPGDEDMHPLAKLTTPDCEEVCYFYEHAIVATINRSSGEVWVTRME